MIGKRLRRHHARPPREVILKSVVALARYVGRDHHAAGSSAASGAGKGIGRLFQYLLDGSSATGPERVDAGGAFNLVGSKPEFWEAQLVAAADQCPARADPLEHYVLSWPASERPTASQLEASAHKLMLELGLGKCPAVWAAHNDTDNMHLHVAVVRLDLETGKVACLDWDINDLHQALAIIEHEHGWKREKNALYRVENGLLRDARTGACVRDLKTGERFPVERSKRFDLKKETIASQLILELRHIKDWQQFHRMAGGYGLEYVRQGSGARVHSRTGSYRASAIRPALALAKLEAKFGPYEGRRGENGTTYEGYERSYSACLDQLRASQAAAREHLEKVRKEERARLATLLAEAGIQALLLAFNQAIERELAAARAALDATYRKTKKDLHERRFDRVAWQAAGEPAAIDPVPPPAVLFPTLNVSQSAAPAREGPHVQAGSEHRAMTFNVDHRYQSGRIAFSDHRALLIVHNPEQTAICAALELAQQRWGAALVSGSAAFREQCKVLGAERGINVVDAGEPTPLVRHVKVPLTRKRKRPSNVLPLVRLPADAPAPLPVAWEATNMASGQERQRSRAFDGSAIGAGITNGRGEAPALAKAAPVAGSAHNPITANTEGGRPNGRSRVRDASSPPEMPIRPPNRGRGWER